MNTQWFTPEEIATSLRVNKLTIYKYINSGRLQAIKLGRHYRISEKSFNSFIAKSQVKKGSLHNILSQRDYKAVAEVKKRLLDEYGDKIKLIKVFGSKIRQEATKESDLDLLVIVSELDYPLEKRVRKTVHSVNDDFDYRPYISSVIISDADFKYLQNLKTPFYQNVEREGINLWIAA